MNKLRHMSLFAHIVETGSITATADMLGLSKSVVSQHLKALEEELGVVLLKRTTRRQVLTAAGRDFFQSCKVLNAIAEDAWVSALENRESPKGKICITAPNALMQTLVIPATNDLLKLHQDLEIEYLSSDQQLDLYEEGVDLAVRVGRSTESTLKQKRIGNFRDILCGDADYLKGRPLEQLSYIANSWQGKDIKHEFRNGESEELFEYRAKIKCSTNSFHTCLSLIEAGVGIGLVPDFYFSAHKHSLIEVFPDQILQENEVFTLHPFASKPPLAVRLCIQSIELKLKNLKG